MHVKGFLHKLLSDVMHQKRLTVLALVVAGAILTKKISVTNLGRGIAGKMQERSAIRQADRLIGNKFLHGEKVLVYERAIQLLVGNKSRPRIIVDWSPIPNVKQHVLRAALVAEGRALTIYEEVHSEKKHNNTKVQNKFLVKLSKLLPSNCCPIIITDAGFYTAWFKQIVDLGWDYIGRIRGTYQYSTDHGKTWRSCRSLLKKMNLIEKSLGKILFGKRNTIETTLYLIKERSKRRKAKTEKGKRQRNSYSQDHSRSARESWLLASSLKGQNFLHVNRVKKIYKKRMQIEEAFRDLKSSRYGFSFEQASSRSRMRIENLLLIAMLSSLIAWLVGWLGEKNGLHLEFQSNSVKTKRVLSLFFLGCQMIKRKTDVDTKELLSFISKGFCYAG